MDVDVRESIRRRARAARELSTELRAQSQALGGAADNRASRRESRRQRVSRRLEWETAAVDNGMVTFLTMAPFLERDSRMAGRDPVIEQAKTLLCDQYQITRGDAFALLRRTSSHTNRKLRDVARTLVDAAA